MADFYTDNHIAKLTIGELGLLGHVVTRCQSVGLSHASDVRHLDYAASHRLILVTHDKGFTSHSRVWKRQARSGQVPDHSGVLIIPDESIWKPGSAAAAIDSFVRHQTIGINTAYLFRHDGTWTAF